MGLWARLFRLHRPAESARTEIEPAPPKQVVRLPREPFVFECRVCGKIFDARRKRPLCPECDSRDVELLSA